MKETEKQYENMNELIKDIIKYENETKERTKEEEIEYYDKIIKNIDSIFISENYNTSNLDNGQDEIIKTGKMTITLTTTSNQKNNKTNNNMTLLDLGECENLLRDHFNISENETIYMKKIDVKQEGMKIPKIEYSVFCKLNGSNLVKLNLSVCENSKISLSIPIEISENLDKLNTSSDYFNDICYSSTSDSGTDISLKDRQKEFVKGNKTICQEECDFSDYNYGTKRAICSCEVKESYDSFADMNINRTKLYKNFVNFKNIANINILVCYKKLFTKIGVYRNIGCIIIALLFTFHLINVFIFYIKQIDKIKNIIEDIICARKNMNLIVKNGNKRTNKNTKKRKKNNYIIQTNNKQKNKKSNIIPKLNNLNNNNNKNLILKNNKNKVKKKNRIKNKQIQKLKAK